MTSDPSSEAIVRTVVDLARNLDLPVIAEGVEEDEARDRLAAMGCRAAQGYLFSRPLPHDQLVRWLSRQDPAAGDRVVVRLGSTRVGSTAAVAATP